MLRNFIVKNYALIEAIEVEFEKGLNIITGETGAGKSILIDAMGLLLGERASADVVRKDASKAVVEGVFDIKNNKRVQQFFIDNEIESTDELILRREISSKGTSRAFINDSPVVLNAFKELGNYLVDLHGQHEHQSLLRKETHIDYLDEYADVDDLLTEYKKNFENLRNSISELHSLSKQENNLREKKSFYLFQINEIDNINPQLDEDEQLESEITILENSEKLLELSNNAYSLIYDSEDSVMDKLNKIHTYLGQISQYDKSFEENSEECSSAIEIIKDISSQLRNYLNRIDLEGERLESIRNRISSLNMLKKKYGSSLKSIIEYREKIGNEYDKAENFNDNIIKLKADIDDKKKNLLSIATKISKTRKDAALNAEKEIVKILQTLGIENSKIQIRFEHPNNSNDEYSIGDFKLGPKGVDDVEIFLAMNKGEDLKPLSKTASGGEVSRIMLALKSILAKNDKLPLLIFDEIDTGVSGRIAQKLGNALRNLSNSHQIIAITHLPQIAGLSDVHFAVEKKIINDRVFSAITKLNAEQKIREVAKLLSGEHLTEASLQSAKELIKK